MVDCILKFIVFIFLFIFGESLIFILLKEILVKWGSCLIMIIGKFLGLDRVNFFLNINFIGIFFYRVWYNLVLNVDCVMKRKIILIDIVI